MNACEPYCKGPDLQKLKTLSTAGERFYFCRRCNQTFRVLTNRKQEIEVEELEREIKKQA